MQNAEQMAKERGKKSEWDKFVQSLEENETPQTTAEEQEKNKVTKKTPKKKAEKKVEVKETPKAETKQEENQTLTKVDGKAQPTQEQRKLIRDWLEKQDLNRDHPFMPILLNDISTKGVRDYVYGAISQIL